MNDILLRYGRGILYLILIVTFVIDIFVMLII